MVEPILGIICLAMGHDTTNHWMKVRWKFPQRLQHLGPSTVKVTVRRKNRITLSVGPAIDSYRYSQSQTCRCGTKLPILCGFFTQGAPTILVEKNTKHGPIGLPSDGLYDVPCKLRNLCHLKGHPYEQNNLEPAFLRGFNNGRPWKRPK